MDEKSSAYYFATNLLWFTHHVFYEPFEALESGSIADRVDEFEHRLQDLGLWMLDEGRKAGKTFKEDGESKNIYDLSVPQQKKALSWVQSIVVLSESVGLTEPERSHYLLGLECAWLISVYDAYDELVQELDVPDLVQSYIDVREQFMEQRKWLQAQSEEIAKNHLPQDRIGELKLKMREITERLKVDWRAAVFLFARKYSSGRGNV